ncbi:MAG TPA: hypothetical protein VE377_10740 [Candidatus Dormibacteraeota bacterium]|nr:hypothetical protein [Candidatus Dormibacteraeota bacterium]
MQHSFPDRGTIVAVIGTNAILVNAAFVLLGLFLFVGSLWSLPSVRPAERAGTFGKRALDTTSIGVLVIALTFLAGVGYHIVQKVQFHRELSQLRSEAVERIQVGHETITDREQIALIVRVLNQPEWFELRRGDRADEIPFVIRLSDGRQYEYSATRYQHGEGTALLSTGTGREAFYRNLPSVLARAGIAIPDCYTDPSKPVRCAEHPVP